MSLFSHKAYDMLITMTGKKGGVPVLVGELEPFFNWQSSISRQIRHVRVHERALNDNKNYAQKGCAMQLWGITLIRCLFSGNKLNKIKFTFFTHPPSKLCSPCSNSKGGSTMVAEKSKTEARQLWLVILYCSACDSRQLAAHQELSWTQPKSTFLLFFNTTVRMPHLGHLGL